MQKLRLHNRDQQIIKALDLNNQDIKESDKKQKFEKMSASPYHFYRGSNHLFWEDFYNDWRINFFGGQKETLTWINGDAHIYNYGAYANHDGEAIFCMDDFDDSIIADYQFDLWRMAVSIVLDCREQRVFNRSVQKRAVKIFAKAYRDQMSKHKDDDPYNEKHLNKKTAQGLLKKFLKKVEKNKDRLKMLNKWTKVENGQRFFDLSNPKVKALSPTKYKALEKVISQYQETVHSDIGNDVHRFKIKDIVAREKAGTGSLGSERYYALLEGDTIAVDDDVILDIKEQGTPPLYDHMSSDEQQEFDDLFQDAAERHALAFEALAEHPDKYLGRIKWNEKSFSVKERSPYKSDFPTEKLKKAEDLFFMASNWGDLLASRHKRASYVLNNQAHEMPAAFAGLVKDKREDFDNLVISIAFQYADCVKQDFKYFKKEMIDD